jgi:hypothetical protein
VSVVAQAESKDRIPDSWRPGAFGLKNLVLVDPAAARDQLAALVPVIERC